MKHSEILREMMTHNKEHPSSKEVYEDDLLHGIRHYMCVCAIAGYSSAFMDRNVFTNRMIDQLKEEGFQIIYNVDRNMLELIWE